ncbi:MAG: hypothetical protein KC652_18655, partial [Cyanobacteria bacterium HKST-UBA01]|nr:hypothetical protein [Cyanobacteria bacterium HKST-UBA01]
VTRGAGKGRLGLLCIEDSLCYARSKTDGFHLVAEFGSPSRVSEFLKGERDLSLEQAKRIAARFRLNIAALI